MKIRIENIKIVMIWTWLSRENLKKKNESILIAMQNNKIRTNYIEAQTDNAQKNSNCRLCYDRDEIVDWIIIQQTGTKWIQE